jgi:hypothetical protein
MEAKKALIDKKRAFLKTKAKSPSQADDEVEEPEKSKKRKTTKATQDSEHSNKGQMVIQSLSSVAPPPKVKDAVKIKIFDQASKEKKWFDGIISDTKEVSIKEVKAVVFHIMFHDGDKAWVNLNSDTLDSKAPNKWAIEQWRRREPSQIDATILSTI